MAKYETTVAFSRKFCREIKIVNVNIRFHDFFVVISKVSREKYGKIFSSNQNCQQPKTAEPCVLTNFFSEKGIVTEYVWEEQPQLLTPCKNEKANMPIKANTHCYNPPIFVRKFNLLRSENWFVFSFFYHFDGRFWPLKTSKKSANENWFQISRNSINVG